MRVTAVVGRYVIQGRSPTLSGPLAVRDSRQSMAHSAFNRVSPSFLLLLFTAFLDFAATVELALAMMRTSNSGCVVVSRAGRLRVPFLRIPVDRTGDGENLSCHLG